MNDRPIEPVAQENLLWEVDYAFRVSACDNRPGLKKIYVDVYGPGGEPLRGVKVRFDTEPSEGMAYDHMDVHGPTNQLGHLEWNHLGIPTVYRLFMEDDEHPLIENIRTDLGNEYCQPPGGPGYPGNVPVNRPGVYSYRIGVRRKRE